MKNIRLAGYVRWLTSGTSFLYIKNHLDQLEKSNSKERDESTKKKK